MCHGALRHAAIPYTCFLPASRSGCFFLGRALSDDLDMHVAQRVKPRYVR